MIIKEVTTMGFSVLDDSLDKIQFSNDKIVVNDICYPNLYIVPLRTLLPV